MKKTTLLLWLTLIVSLVTLPRGFAQCGPGQDILQNVANASLVQGSGVLGQSFTVPCNGFIEGVTVWTSTITTAGAANMTIYDGTSGVSPLGSEAFAVSSSGEQITVTFPAPIAVVNGSVYTFIIDPGTSSSDYQGSTGDTYPGGQTWRYQSGAFTAAFAPDVDYRFRIHFVDEVNPIAVCQDITAQLDANGNVTITPADVDGGSSDDSGSFTLSLDNDTFDCSMTGPNSVTLTVTDAAGNTDSCMATVTVEDSIPPAITCPANITVNNDPGVCGAVVTYADPVATDNCPVSGPPVTMTFTGANATPTVYTEAGMSISTADHLDAPWGVACGDTRGFRIHGGYTTNWSYNGGDPFTPISFEACTTNMLFTAPSGATFTPPSTGVVNFPNTSDWQGITSMVYTNTSGTDADFDNFVFSGTIPVSATQTAGLPSGSTFPVGTTTNTFEVTDASGNTSTCSFDVTVTDNEDPVITCPSDIIVSNDPGVCGALVSYNVTATDNCSMDLITNGSFETGDFTGWTINDFASPYIPYFVGPSNNGGGFFPAATPTDGGLLAGNGFDAGGPDTSILYQEVSIPLGTTIATLNWDENIDYNLADFCSGCSDRIYEVQVLDVTNTVLQVLHTVNATAGVIDNDNVWNSVSADLSAYVGQTIRVGFWQNIPDSFTGPAKFALDNVTLITNLSPVVQTAGLPSGSVFPVGTTTNTFEVTDASGNTATCSFDVTVEDNEAPVITCVPDATRDTDPGVCEYTVVGTEFDATFTDNCTSATITNDLNGTATLAGEVLPLGDTTVVWIVDDGNGQSATCTTIITIEDNEDPVITCVPNATRDTDPGVCEYTVVGTEFDATFTDNCTSATITNDLNGTATLAGEVLPLGDTTVVWVVDDGNGQTATCTTLITIEDNETPVITCVPNAIRDTDPGVCEYTVVGTEFDATFTDNCTSATITNDLNGTATLAGEVLPLGDTTVVWIVDDGNGQTATCTTVITIEDNEAPVITCVPNAIRDTDPGVCEYTVVGTEFDATFTDNCTSATITNDLNGTATLAGEVLPLGDTTVVWIVDDGNGQSATCTTVITVEDNEAPIIACPADITANTTPGDCFAEVTFAPAIAVDNCGIASVVQTAGLPSGSQFPVGVSTIEYTATDVNGNISTCSFTITITDNEAPMAVCQNITIQLDATGNATIVAADIDGGSSDNCGIASISASQTAFDCSHVGDNNVILTVTDVNGNESTCTAIVTVEDVTDPVVACMDITVELDVNGTVTILPTDIDNGSSDACGIASYELDIDTFTCDDVGDNIVTLTVTDVNGNTSSCTAIVTVEDNTAPVLICMDITVELDENGLATITPADVIGTISDACGIATSAIDITDFDCSDIGTPVMVTVFTSDVNGNLSSCTATVTVVDLLGPIVICPEDQTVDPGPGNLFYTVPDYFATGEASATDNCTDPVTIFSQDPAAGTQISDGVYTVSVCATDAYGNETCCTFELTVESILGVNDVTDLGSITMYPNPANDYVILSNPQSLGLDNVAIYDITGRLIRTIALEGIGTEKQIDLYDLASATYLFVISGENGMITKQIIKD